MSQSGASNLYDEIKQCNMLKVLGEMIKEAANTTLIKELICVVTDALIKKVGADNCYFWYANERIETSDYVLTYRCIDKDYEIKEKRDVMLPRELVGKKEIYLFDKEEIMGVFNKGIRMPLSRLAIPIVGTNNNIIGILVVEKMKENFFDSILINFFETLAIFVAYKIESSRLLQNVTEKSIKDPLTGIYNRRHLKNALKVLKSKHSDVTVAIVDTDNFKSINDKLGHTEGDTVLKAIAQLAKGVIKETEGEVVRYGGDEFVILLPKPLDESINIFEEFRKCVHYLRIPYNLETDVSVTVGVSSYPEIIGDYNELIKTADQALLQGKESGKNRIVVATSEIASLNE